MIDFVVGFSGGLFYDPCCFHLTLFLFNLLSCKALCNIVLIKLLLLVIMIYICFSRVPEEG